MNWFTHNTNLVVDVERYCVGYTCEHLKEGDTADVVSFENDGFGDPEGSFYCSDCWDKAQEEMDSLIEECYDCGKEFEMRDLLEWKCYDFYPAQGDEPLLICKACRCADKHKARVREDRRAYEEEMDYYDNY